ncbi:sugar transferase [Rubrobacter taiwanensis]|uniref:Sugar transferase n=1 Tax=Rubrobacter taiwanensis TaxID=185139 RepID=A0A4R1BE30_9ACTN|nr:sugar transferase [Rubrobacter taiwanensis]TCJ15258.1 sugar transferase [Rubrobacter taiwanensis]
MRAFIKRLLSLYPVRRPLSILALMAIDAVALLAGLLIAGYLVAGENRVSEIFYLAPVLLTVWLSLFAANGLYDRAPERRNPGALLAAILLGAGLFAFGSVIYPETQFVLGEILVAAALALLLDGGLRLLYEQGIEFIYRRGFGLITTVVVGDEESRRKVRRIIEQQPSAYSVVGELGMSGDRVDLGLLRRILDRTGARNVVLAGAERLPDEEFLSLLHSMRLRGVRVRVVPGTITLMSGRSILSQRVGMPLMEVGYPQLDNNQRLMKRVLDIAGAAGGLVVLSPLLLAVAVLIKLTSPGPVFFKQKRVGADETVFLCYKFRSMYQDAERRQAELEAENEADGAIFKIRKDPRVTPVGRFIRRWSIDELPQLINVLKGEMSLVGPRPLPLRDYERMDEHHKQRLSAVPGITGYWQISGRSDLSFEEMVRLDLYYIKNWSLSLDLKIILKTLKVVVTHEGAY